MSVSILPVSQINVASSTVKDLKVAFDLVRENQITLKDFICQIEVIIGDLGLLPTADQSSIVNSILELYQSFVDGDDNLQTDIDNILNNIIKFETLTNNGDGTYTWNDGNGNSFTFEIRQENVVNNGDGTFTFTNGDGGSVTWDGSAQTPFTDADTLDGIDSSDFYHALKANTTIRMGSGTSASNWDGITYNEATNTFTLKADTAEAGTTTGGSVLKSNRLCLTSLSDASGTSTNHAFEISSGNNNGAVVKFDTNEIVYGNDGTGTYSAIIYSNIALKSEMDEILCDEVPNASAADIAALDGNDRITICRNGGPARQFELDDLSGQLGQPTYTAANFLAYVHVHETGNGDDTTSYPASTSNRMISVHSISGHRHTVSGTGIIGDSSAAPGLQIASTSIYFVPAGTPFDIIWRRTGTNDGSPRGRSHLQIWPV